MAHRNAPPARQRQKSGYSTAAPASGLCFLPSKKLTAGPMTGWVMSCHQFSIGRENISAKEDRIPRIGNVGRFAPESNRHQKTSRGRTIRGE
jgi:hypothetical protein